MTAEAARYGHLDVIEWALDIGCLWDLDACDAAAEQRQFHVIVWARSRGLEIPAAVMKDISVSAPRVFAILQPTTS